MSPTKALFWKEWRQIQWRLAFMLMIACVFVFVGLKTRVVSDEVIVFLSYGFCAFLMPLFIAMALFVEEREQGSLPMQLKLPITAGKVYAVKIVTGTLAAIAPAAACLVITLIMAGNREMTSAKIICIYGFCMPFDILFVLWTIAFSINRKTQWAAALTGIAILAGWVFVIAVEEMFLGGLSRGLETCGVFIDLYQIMTPLGFLEAGWDNGRWLAVLISQSFWAVILFFWGLQRFSTLTRSGK